MRLPAGTGVRKYSYKRWPAVGAMNRAPTPLTAGICFHSWRPALNELVLSWEMQAI